MLDTFLTDRLVAQRPHDDDLDDLCRMNRDPVVMATLAGIRSVDETRLAHRRNLEHWERYGFGIWIYRDRRDGRFAGRGGFRHVTVEGADEVELAYAYMPEFWGRGLATEMARATLALAFGRLGLAEIVAFTLPTNLASRRVMEKAGFAFDRDVNHA